MCDSRQAAVRRPEQAAARTDCRKRLRIAGTFASLSRAASTRASRASTFETIRLCSAIGGSGTEAFSRNHAGTRFCPTEPVISAAAASRNDSWRMK